MASPSIRPLSPAERGLSPPPLRPQSSGSVMYRDGERDMRPMSSESRDGSPVVLSKEDPLLENIFLMRAKSFISHLNLATRIWRGYGLTDSRKAKEFIEDNPHNALTLKINNLRSSENSPFVGNKKDFLEMKKLAQKIDALAHEIASQREEEQTISDQLKFNKARIENYRRILKSEERLAVDEDAVSPFEVHANAMDGLELAIEVLKAKSIKLKTKLETSLAAEKRAYENVQKLVPKFKNLLGDRI